MDAIGNKTVKEAMHIGVISVNKETTAKDVCKIFSKNHISAVVCKDNKDYVGIVTDTDILKTFELCKVKCTKPDFCPITANDIMTKKLITISPDENLSCAANLMIKHRIHRILVKSDDDIIGILSATDITREIGKTAKTTPDSFYSKYDKYFEIVKSKHEPYFGIGNKKIYEIMTQGVFTIPMDSNVREVAKVISDKKIHRILVMNTDGEVLGIISTMDILKVFSEEFAERPLDDIIAGDIMTDGIKAVEQWRTIEYTVKKMNDEHIHALLVLFLPEGKSLDESVKKPIMAMGALRGTHIPIGFLSTSDILKAIANSG